MVTLSCGRALSFCCCAAVFGTITWKPAATSEFSLLCVLAQPIARASSAMELRILNGVRICFMVFYILALDFSGKSGELGLASSRRTVGETKRRSASAARMAGRRSEGEARLDDIAAPSAARGVVGIFVDREKDEAGRSPRAPELACRFDAVQARHGNVE